MNKEIIEIFKNEFDEIIKKYNDYFAKEIKCFVTEVFLYDNYYKFEANKIDGKYIDIKDFTPDPEKEKEEGYVPAYSIVNTGKYFPPNEFITVGDLLKNITGIPRWIKGIGYTTYEIELEDYLINLVLKKMEQELIKNKVSAKPALLVDNLLEDNDLSHYVWKSITKEIAKMKKLKLLDVVSELQEEITKKRIKDLISNDMEILEVEREKIEFLKIKKEILNMFNKKSKEFFLNTPKLKKDEWVEYELLQFWAKKKTFNEIKLFNNYYPLEKELHNYRWLDREIYKDKFFKYQKSKEIVSNLLGKKKVKKLAPFYLRQVFTLYEKILMMKTNKIVYLIKKGGFAQNCYTYIDKFGRIGNNVKDSLIFLNYLEDAILDGYIFINSESEEKYQLTFGNKEITKNSRYIYGIFMNDLQFDGMKSDEIKDLYIDGVKTNKDHFPLRKIDQFKDFDF